MTGVASLLKFLRRTKAPKNLHAETAVVASTRAISTREPQSEPVNHDHQQPVSYILRPSICANALAGMHTPESKCASIHSLTTFRDCRAPGFDRLMPRTLKPFPRVRNINNLVVDTSARPLKLKPLPVLISQADVYAGEPPRPKATAKENLDYMVPKARRGKKGKKGKPAPALAHPSNTSSGETSCLCCFPSVPAKSTLHPKPIPNPARAHAHPRPRIYAPGEGRNRNKGKRQPKPQLRLLSTQLSPPPPLPRPSGHFLDVGITESPQTYHSPSLPRLLPMDPFHGWSFSHSAGRLTPLPSLHPTRKTTGKDIKLVDEDPHSPYPAICRLDGPDPMPRILGADVGRVTIDDHLTNMLETAICTMVLNRVDEELAKMELESAQIDDFLRAQKKGKGGKKAKNAVPPPLPPRPAREDSSDIECCLIAHPLPVHKTEEERLADWEAAHAQFVGFAWRGRMGRRGRRNSIFVPPSPRTKME